MAKFYGVIGYGVPVETAPGVWQDSIVERTYSGDIIRTARTLLDDENINSELTVGNAISIVADAYANDHFFAIRYIQWAGTLWVVREVEVESPRLILRLGGVYHGPTVGSPITP